MKSWDEWAHAATSHSIALGTSGRTEDEPPMQSLTGCNCRLRTVSGPVYDQ